MQILSIHNRYQIKGGEDECHQAEVNLLRKMGNQVDVYEEDNLQIHKLNNLQKIQKTIWSRQAYQTVINYLRKQKYDIVHIHNFFPLISPSVYYAIQNEGIPIVQTLHNYRLLCPNALFFRQGHICEECLGKIIPYPGVINGCYRNSKMASGCVATMLSLHRILQTWQQKVNTYIALTEFARQKFIAGGIPAQKIVVKPNFTNDSGIGTGSGNYALFVGRLSPEKGIDTLLTAWKNLGDRIPLKIIGDGPLASQVQQVANQQKSIQWLGHKPIETVHKFMGEAKFLVFPSQWYETFGRVAIEAFSKGTPVIAANIGAIAELVNHNKTGLLFQPGDPLDLTRKVEYFLTNPTQLMQMRHTVRREFEQKYTANQNYRLLMNIYTQACCSHSY